MSDTIKILIVILCSIILLILCAYIILHKSKEYRDKFIERAARCGNYTKGVLVDARANNLLEAYNIKIIKAMYTFDVDGKQYKKVVHFIRDYEVNFPYPFNVQLYYSRRKPEVAYCKEETAFNRYISNACKVTFAVIVCTSICLCGIILR